MVGALTFRVKKGRRKFFCKMNSYLWNNWKNGTPYPSSKSKGKWIFKAKI